MAGQRPPRRIAPKLPKPHWPEMDPKTGLCAWCPLPEQHEVHSRAAVEAAAKERDGWKAHDARRVGERQST